jgi:toxin-antitoxin system PIN domain toxin
MTEQRKQLPFAGAPRGDLPDVNVWLALAVPQHPHHSAAATYWRDHPGGQIWFCRVTMLGLVRLLSNPKVMGPQALRLTEALAAYQRFVSLPDVAMHAETGECDSQLQQLLAAELPTRLLTDAYLAAFAASAGLRLVTFDKDFDRFSGLIRLRLPAAHH